MYRTNSCKSSIKAQSGASLIAKGFAGSRLGVARVKMLHGLMGRPDVRSGAMMPDSARTADMDEDVVAQDLTATCVTATCGDVRRN